MNLNYSYINLILIFLQGIINPIVINNILTQINILEKIELKISDKITTLNKAKNIPDDIVLVNLDNTYLQKNTITINFKERKFYASLVKSLLEAQAAVVVLNFPSNWRQIPDKDYWLEVESLNSELKDVISTYRERLVLVNPIHSLSSLEKHEINIYNHLLPKNDKAEFIIDPTNIQGFFEWNILDQNINNLSNPARIINLQNNYILQDNNIFSEDFKSFGILATDKYYKYLKKTSTNLSHEYPNRFQIKYLGKSGIFNQLNIKNVCQINNLKKSSEKITLKDINKLSQSKCEPTLNLKDKVAQKIVIVGFNYGQKSNLDNSSVRSPFGEIIPAMELQANIIGNLLTKSYYQIIPTWTNILILITVSLILCLLIIKPVKIFKKDSYIFSFISLYAILTSVYIVSVFILLSNNFVLPIIFPLLTWLLSGIFNLFSFKYLEKIKRIKEKEIEIIVLKKAEKEAILLQTKKILKRTAIDIHDGPLQRLKLLMDNIELEAEPELILNALEDVGMDIRNHLIEINKIADKLEINPILNQGLEVGFKTTLNNLIKSGKLTLKVIDNIEKIEEPIANSIWLDMREDIYRFFKEAINNIIIHAQPPNGNATQVQIILRQEHCRYKLTIINDGISEKNSIKKEGIGTKIMAVIADNLPKVEYKVSNSDDYFKVELSWELDLFN